MEDVQRIADIMLALLEDGPVAETAVTFTSDGMSIIDAWDAAVAIEDE